MLVAARSPVRAGLVAWPDRPGVSTLVVKQTYDVVPRGRAILSDEQEPLCLESRNDGDVVLYPTDFAPTKSACDVVFVGAVLIDALGPARLAVDPVRKLVEHPRELGPCHGVGLDGDPTHPDVYRQWGNPTFDFDAFQCAPRDQRRPATSLPMDIVYDLGSTRISTSLEGPIPEAALLDEAGWLAPKMVTLRADTVLIDPVARRISVLFRGVVDVPDDVDGLVVIEAQAPLRSFNAHEMAGWPRAEAVDPAFLRRLRQMSSAARSATSSLDDEASWGTTARLDSTTNIESPRGTSTLRDTVAFPGGASPLRSMRDTVALSSAEEPTTPPAPAASPVLGPPLRSPSFGAPPPIPSEPPPAAASAPLPKARLGGLMMLPLETRNPPAPSSSPAPSLRRPTSSPPLARERRTSAPPPASPSEAPPFRTTLATLPEVVREPSALPFAPSTGSTASLLSPDATPFDRRGSSSLSQPPPLQRSSSRTVPLPERDGPATTPSTPRRSSTLPPPDGSSPGRPPTLPPPPAVLRVETPFQQPIASVAAWSPPRLPVDVAPPPFTPPSIAPSPIAFTPPSPVATPAAAPEATAPVPRAVAPAPKREEERDDETGLAHSDFVAIKAELWSNPEARARTLSARGLTDLEWRRVERRFAVKLGRRVALATDDAQGGAPSLDPGS